MKKFRVLALAMVLILAIGLLSACSSKPEPAPAPAPAPTTEPAPAPAPEPAPAETGLKDGVYKAENEKFDDYGWKSFVEIEIKDGKIATVKYDAVNKDGALKTQDAAYKAAMEPKTKTYPEKAFAELQASLVEKQDVAAVAAVSGATNSSNEFKGLAEKALAQAK